MRKLFDADHGVAALLFLVSMGVYAATTSPSIAFWDCGEFVSSAYTLGIPHQPGTPLYVLVGKVFSLLPLFGLTVARKINLMSGFFAALAVVFMYLTALRLQRNWVQEKVAPSPAWLQRTGAAVGALFLAFSTTFWTSAIEAEVYSLASFTLAFVSFLAVRWYELRDKASSATLMLLIVYLMGMSVGFHMGSILVFPGVFLMVILADRKALTSVDMVLVSGVMGAFVLSTMKAPDLLVLFIFGVCLAGAIWRLLTYGSQDEIAENRWFALAGIALFLLGLSVHLFMLIRAHQDPLINQTDPTTFDRLLTVLRREQYPPRSPFHREAPLIWQIGHFLGSVSWKGGQLAGRPVTGYLQQFTFFSKPNFADTLVPLTLWVFGLWYQLKGHWRQFWVFFVVLLVNSVGLIILLNFTDQEVRDRDYFYFGAYQFLSLFISLGAAGLLRSAWETWKDASATRLALKCCAGLLILLPLSPVLFGPFGHQKWFEHDRSHNLIARNYGYNILASLPPNAILATNGDNDTFPLWYLQQVEGYRTDVRVVNLSLINLPWYIKQLRDYEPTVPIRWNDAQIDGKEDIVYRKWRCRLEAERMPDGEPAWVRDKTMWHIVRENKWERPIYYAVTVPNRNIGMFVPYLEMEGLVYRLTPDRNETGDPRIDPDKIWRNFTEVYDFRSVLDAEGNADHTVYRDAQSEHLLRNYPAALGRVGYFAAKRGDFDLAQEALEFAYGLEPTFPVVGDILPYVYMRVGEYDKAEAVAEKFLEVEIDPVRSAMDVAQAYLQLDKPERAVKWSKELYDRAPDVPDYTQLYVRSLVLAGRDEDARGIMEEWVRRTGDV